MQTAQAAEAAAAEARWRSGEQAGELEAAGAREHEARLRAEAEARAMQQASLIVLWSDYGSSINTGRYVLASCRKLVNW